MKPFIALLAFMSCILAVYHLPTPDPSLHLNEAASIETEMYNPLFDEVVEFVDSPLEISIP